MINATCKICGFEKTFEGKYAGKTFKCPNCTSPVKIEKIVPTEETKVENQEVVNQPIPATNIKNESKSNKSIIVYSIVFGAIVFLIYSLIIYNKGTNDNTTINMVDNTASVNTVKPEDYWQSQKGNNNIIYETGYYKKKYIGSEYGNIYINSDGSESANQYLNDDVIIKIDKVENGYGYLSYVNSNSIQSYGWVKMEDLEKAEDPNITDIDIDEAKNQYSKYYNSILERDKSNIYDLLSNTFENYMGKTKYTKDEVYNDASKYMDRWKLISEELNSFTKLSKNQFSYSKRITVVKVDDETIERIFDVEGIIGFDSEMKINYLNDIKTIRIN